MEKYKKVERENKILGLQRKSSQVNIYLQSSLNRTLFVYNILIMRALNGFGSL